MLTPSRGSLCSGMWVACYDAVEGSTKGAAVAHSWVVQLSFKFGGTRDEYIPRNFSYEFVNFIYMCIFIFVILRGRGWDFMRGTGLFAVRLWFRSSLERIVNMTWLWECSKQTGESRLIDSPQFYALKTVMKISIRKNTIIVSLECGLLTCS